MPKRLTQNPTACLLKRRNHIRFYHTEMVYTPSKELQKLNKKSGILDISMYMILFQSVYVQRLPIVSTNVTVLSISIYIYIYIYLLQQYLIVTISTKDIKNVLV